MSGRFEYPFQSRYATVDGVRLHYLDEYRLPYDTPSKRAGIAAFAKLIPDHASHPNAAYIDEIRRQITGWRLPVLVIWPDGDMAWKPDEGERIARLFPQSEFPLVRNAGHYQQEDAGAEIASRMIRFLDARVKTPEGKIHDHAA